MENKHQGSCLCRTVSFEILGEFQKFYLCHCMYCQKDTGSAHAANLVSGTAKLIWIKGEDNIQTFVLPSTRHTKSFCKTCGSGVPSLHLEGKMLIVPAGSLNCEITLRPDAHIFYSSKSSWEENLENIQKIEKFP